MGDGVRLAATLYIPDSAGPWPALLEAYPYRKDDLAVWADDYRRLRDEGDYVVCRLDVRGTGTSEGIAVDEYPPQEADDLCEVISWLAAQEWCTGSVGMFGSSYSGFNTLHVAMRQPAALKAIIPIYATDDRYTDDVHFNGGIRKAIEFGYPLSMVASSALPPVPALAGSDWRERWLRRIEDVVPWNRAIDEQNDSPYWRRGSLRPDYELIRVPTMVVAGWADVYRNAMLRIFEQIDVPKRLLLGPWSHMLPNDSIPGPHLDFVHEMIRWWDRWLREIPNGVVDEPPVRVFIQRSASPEPDLAQMIGEWRFEPEWPPARTRVRTLELGQASRQDRAVRSPDEDSLAVRGDIGVSAHIRGSYPPPYGLPLDQRPDEAYSLCYDWPVEAEFEVLGNPVVELAVRASEAVAFVSAKLCEVLADGTSVLVSRGILNLTHRDSDEHPEAVTPGKTYSVQIELDATSRVFQRNNILRLSIAGSDWPNAWPPPRAFTLTVLPGASRIKIPIIEGDPPVEKIPRFLPPPEPEAPEGDQAGRSTWRIERDVYERETTVVCEQIGPREPLEGGSFATRTEHVRAGVRTGEPGLAWVESVADAKIEWPEVTARAVAELHLRSDAEHYMYDLELRVFENGNPIATRNWRVEVPRLLQ
jgi:putative CocE/NonD family hydrolase